MDKIAEARSNLTKALASPRPDPIAVEQSMAALVHYLGKVDDILADLERDYEDEKIRIFLAHKKEHSVNQADLMARHTPGKGDIARLTRISKSCWNTITSAQVILKNIERNINVNSRTT